MSTPTPTPTTDLTTTSKSDKALVAVKRSTGLVVGVVSTVFLLNLPFVEDLFLPFFFRDNYMIVGNLDEFIASALLLWSIRLLGFSPGELLRNAWTGWREKRAQRKAAKEATKAASAS